MDLGSPVSSWTYPCRYKLSSFAYGLRHGSLSRMPLLDFSSFAQSGSILSWYSRPYGVDSVTRHSFVLLSSTYPSHSFVYRPDTFPAFRVVWSRSFRLRQHNTGSKSIFKLTIKSVAKLPFFYASSRHSFTYDILISSRLAIWYPCTMAQILTPTLLNWQQMIQNWYQWVGWLRGISKQY